jgi:hypothetical protein
MSATRPRLTLSGDPPRRIYRGDGCVLNGMIESWRGVPGFPLYEVSQLGRIRSAGSGRVLKQRVDIRHGRSRAQAMSVTLGETKRRRRKRVHRLVLAAFVGPCPRGLEGCHNDGDIANNRLSNLRWDTPAANQADSLKHGTLVRPKGEQHPRALLSEEAVREIRSAPRQYGFRRKLAAKYGVTVAAIQGARYRHTWTYLA